jgi:hypothetical protein
MNKRRLLRLADLLEADAANKEGVKFELAGWGVNRKGGPAVIGCQTTACAVGLAVLSGAFKRAGLRNASAAPYEIVPAIGTIKGYNAVAILFEIDYLTAAWLFSEGSYPTRKQRGANAERYVAKRIRDFVAGKIAP